MSEDMKDQTSGLGCNGVVRTDWRGMPVPEDETPETIIKWWEVDPHPTRRGYVMRERSWQSMLEFVGENLDMLLEQDDVEENGCSITFRVAEGTIEEYEEGMEE